VFEVGVNDNIEDERYTVLEAFWVCVRILEGSLKIFDDR